MPDIPTNTGSVGDSVVAGGSLPMAASPESYGAAVGTAVSDMGDVADHIHQMALRHFNQLSVMDAHNKLDDYNQGALFDPKTGLLNSNTGKDAPGAVAKTMADYDEHAGKLSDGLANEQQKTMFARLAQENRRTVQAHLNDYETRQVNAYGEQVTQATVKNAATSAVRGVNGVLSSPDPRLADPETRATTIDGVAKHSIDAGAAAIADHFRAVNPTAPANDPRLVEQLNAYQSAAHYGVIQSLLSQSKDQDADAYYKAHKGDLIGQEADTAARMVDAGSTAGDALRGAPAIVYDGDGKMRSRGDAYAMLDGDPKLKANPKLYEATAAQVDKLFRHHDEAQQADDRTNFDAGYDIAQTAPGGFSDPAAQAKFASITSPELRERAKALARRPDRSIPDDSDTYIFAKARLADNDVDPVTGKRPSEEPPQKYRGDMSPGDFKQYVNAWEAKRGEVGKSEVERGTESATRIISDALGKASIKDKMPNGDMNKDAIDFRRQVNDMVLANGGIQKVGTKGVQAICDDLMWQQTETKERSALNPAKWFAAVDPTYTVQTGPRRFQSMVPGQALTPRDIPAGIRTKIVQKMAAQGLPKPTDDEVFHYYTKHPDGG